MLSELRGCLMQRSWPSRILCSRQHIKRAETEARQKTTPVHLAKGNRHIGPFLVNLSTQSPLPPRSFIYKPSLKRCWQPCSSSWLLRLPVEPPPLANLNVGSCAKSLIVWWSGRRWDWSLSFFLSVRDLWHFGWSGRAVLISSLQTKSHFCFFFCCCWRYSLVWTCCCMWNTLKSNISMKWFVR